MQRTATNLIVTFQLISDAVFWLKKAQN